MIFRGTVLASARETNARADGIFVMVIVIGQFFLAVFPFLKGTKIRDCQIQFAPACVAINFASLRSSQYNNPHVLLFYIETGTIPTTDLQLQLQLDKKIPPFVLQEQYLLFTYNYNQIKSTLPPLCFTGTIPTIDLGADH